LQLSTIESSPGVEGHSPATHRMLGHTTRCDERAYLGRILFRKLSSRSHRLNRFGLYAEGMLLYLFWLLVRPMTPEQASSTGRMLIRRLGPRSHKHRQLKRNLELAFPDLEKSQREFLAINIWGNFGAVMAEYPHLSTLTAGASSPFINVILDEDTRAIVEAKRPAIYVTAHIGNWELVASTIVKSGIPLSVIYGPQSNPVLERMIQKKRRSLGCRLIAKQNGIRQMIREIRSGRSVGLLPDQRVDSGEPVPFFGRDAPTTTSPAWLALKLNCPLIPVQIERTGDTRFRAVFHRPLLNGDKTDVHTDPFQVTINLNRLFENWIRNRPDQWLCMKRRWLTDTCNISHGNNPPCG